MNIDISPKYIGWIAGMPRSGTNWLSQIFASSPEVRLKFCPLFSYEFKNKLNETNNSAEWQLFFEEVYRTRSDYMDQEYLRKDGLVPNFSEKKEYPEYLMIKSTRFHNLIPHILNVNNKIRFLHIVRDPRATIYSWINNNLEFPKEANPTQEWKTGTCRKNADGEFWGFDDWKFVNLQALKLQNKYPDRFLILRYEDLTRNALSVTKSIFKFFGLDFCKQTSDFITLSQTKHNDNKRSVYKKMDTQNSWEDKLDNTIAKKCLEETIGTDLEQFLHRL